MSDMGNQIVEGLATVRELHKSAAKSLQLATARMKSLDWEVPLRSAACGSRGSKVLYNTAYWLPEDSFQLFRYEKYTGDLDYIPMQSTDIN